MPQRLFHAGFDVADGLVLFIAACWKKDENGLVNCQWGDKGNIGRFHRQMPIPL